MKLNNLSISDMIQLTWLSKRKYFTVFPGIIMKLYLVYLLFFRLLCLDGGGVRGLILIQMLSEFEIIAGRPIIDCFDWVAGTSAGGILALALSTGRNLSECRCLFFKFKNEAFKGDRPYTSESIEKLFKEYFSRFCATFKLWCTYMYVCSSIVQINKINIFLAVDTLFSSIKHPKLLITSVKTDRYPLCLHIFRNYTSPVDILNFGNDKFFFFI